METRRETPQNPDELTGDSLYEYIASCGDTGMIMSLGFFSDVHSGGGDFACISSVEDRLGKRLCDITISIGPDVEDTTLIAARVRVRDDH